MSGAWGGGDGSSGSSGRWLRWDKWPGLRRGLRVNWCNILFYGEVFLLGNSPLALQVLDPIQQIIGVGPEFRNPTSEGQKIVPNSPNSFLQTSDLALQGWGRERTIGPAATEILIEHDDDCSPQATNQGRTPRSVDGPPSLVIQSEHVSKQDPLKLLTGWNKPSADGIVGNRNFYSKTKQNFTRVKERRWMG